MADQLVPSSSFSSTPSWEYDVFLSFRGTDTRTNFTNHLYHALIRHGIRTFLDDSELPRGEEISPTLLKAIENSRISVIVFSENYASSRWCLDELVHILECRESRRQMTWPIFYKVDPSDVRHQKNSYGVAFAVPSRKYENDPEKVQRWRTALTKAANLKGDTLNEKEYETTFIDRIVEEISIQVSNRTCLNVARYPVGIESCAKEVEELLGVGGNDRRVVGIWGASGIGKTTIAKAVYDAIAHKFEGSCFLADVRETLTSHEGVIKLQNTLLSKVLRGTKLKIDEVHHGISLIKNRLRQKKILLILDDVDKLEQLKDWVDADCFGEGSRVIVTTKDRSLLDFYGGQRIYEVQKLGDDKALELFSWNSFESNRPPDDYLSLARRAIAYAQGLPLALNIIGSHLRNKCIDRWQAILDGYDSYDGEPYTIIEKILRKTYDAWDYGLQQVFLDIACFFNGENKDYVLQILGSSTLNVRQDCIKVLIEKAIITIEDDQILMHDLLQKMGKQIVYEESPTEPGKRSRLWFHEDVCHVLTANQGTKKIRSIVVELPKSDEILLNPESFLKMENLEIFINRNANFSGRVDCLPNSLRWIDLGGQSKHTVDLNLSSNFHPRNLVCFEVPHCSSIRQLNGFKNFAKLTRMNLSGCEFLEKIPDLCGSPNIRELYLSDCTSLVEVDDSVGFLDKLQFLVLSGCSKLTRFPTRLGLRSLQTLWLDGCTRLERFPEIEKDKMKSLSELHIEGSGIRELPSSSAYLTGLMYLYANGCELQNVPDLSGSPNISILDLSGCSKLPRSQFYVPLGGCRRLETNLPRILVLEGCNLSESDFLGPLDCWSALTKLWLSRNNFVTLPDCISKAVNLEELYLTDCKRLREIPVLPPKLKGGLLLDGCTSLEKIPKLPPRLELLELRNCFGLSGDEVAKLENNLLNGEIYPCSGVRTFYPQSTIYCGSVYGHSTIYPGNEVPKWFTYTSNHPTSLLPLPESEWDEDDREDESVESEWDEDDREDEFVGGSEFRFEIPLKLQAGKTLFGLALSIVVEPSSCDSDSLSGAMCIFFNGKKTFDGSLSYYCRDLEATHVIVTIVGLEEQEQQGDICIVVFHSRFKECCPIKSCGVHCLLRDQDELLHLSLRPKSSLGKRPHPRGSSDIVDDEYDQQQQWLSSSSEPADDHPKRRQIDPNVPMNMEED